MPEKNKDFKQKIKDLRIALEKSVEKLRKLEATGTENDANSSLWAVSSVWNGKEYSTIETELRIKGHKSCLDELRKKQ